MADDKQEDKFDIWNRRKRALDAKEKLALFKEGEVWWCHCGVNVGREINGKGKLSTRPVFILRKFSTISFYGVPLTTQDKTGSRFYHKFECNDREQFACLTQLRLFDVKRLQRKLIDLPEEAAKELKEAIKKALIGLL